MRLLVIIGIVVIGITVAYFMSKDQLNERKLPVIQPKDL